MCPQQAARRHARERQTPARMPKTIVDRWEEEDEEEDMVNDDAVEDNIEGGEEVNQRRQQAIEQRTAIH